MRAGVVVNPVAGGGRTRRLWPRLERQLRELGFAFRARETRGPGDATALARAAVADGFPLVIAVGGDGTVNEVVNGLGDPPGRVASLGIVVTGRGADACRNLGVVPDPGAAVRRVADGEEIWVDLGVVEWGAAGRRYFVNAAGVGFDAVVAERTRSGRGGGTIPYLRGMLGALHAHRPVPATIGLDGTPVSDGPITAAVVANGAFYGGGMQIAPGADPADGRLDLVVLGDLGRWEMIRWLPTLYRGAHLANPKVAPFVGRTITVTAAGRMPVHLDGEPVGEVPIRISVCPRALRLRR